MKFGSIPDRNWIWKPYKNRVTRKLVASLMRDGSANLTKTVIREMEALLIKNGSENLRLIIGPSPDPIRI